MLLYKIIIKNKKHGTPEGLAQIRLIKPGMNKGKVIVDTVTCVM